MGVGEHQVDRTRHLIYIHNIYILYINLYINVLFFCLTYVTSSMLASCTFLVSLLQSIGQNFCMTYTQIVVFLYIMCLFFFFASIIGIHNCSYSAILNSFLYLYNSAL